MSEKVKYPEEPKEALSKRVYWFPTVFLLMVTWPDSGLYRPAVEEYKERILKGKPLDVPFLIIDCEKQEGVDHEGRHRAMASKELGIEDMPIDIYCYCNREYTIWEECAKRGLENPLDAKRQKRIR